MHLQCTEMSSGSEQRFQQNCLIIGDGNFSFSVSFTNRTKNYAITATSLETKENVLSHDGAAENLKFLQENGVAVHHRVDGTKLNTFQAISGLLFSLIIFNFPHTGGKSNIKENRELVKQFLSSSSQFLDSEGEIWLTLCRGQGGTPVDCLQRGYENSWKVVELAGEAGLVLSHVQPFCCQDWPQYRPTGYRGSDGHFVTSSALTHTFTKPQLYKNASGYSKHLCNTCFSITTNDFNLPNASEEPNFLTHPLLQQEWHPLRKARDSLTNLLCSISDPRPSIDHKLGFHVHKFSSICINKCLYNLLYCSLSPAASASLIPCAYEPCLSCRVDGLCSEGITSPTSAISCIVSAPVLCWLPTSSAALPVSHQLLYCVGCSDPSVCANLCLTVTRILGELLNVSQDAFKWEEIKNILPATTIIKSGMQQQCLLEGQVLCKVCSYDGKGTMFFGYCIFYLDPLACMPYDIPDQRLLWSRDRRFADQFSNETSSTFKPFSLYPPKYIHNISFWVNISEYRRNYCKYWKSSNSR